MPSMTLRTPLCISIFPEKETGSHLKRLDGTEDESAHRRPLDWGGIRGNGLMTVNEFMQGGHELRDAKILVAVKSVGARKKGK